MKIHHIGYIVKNLKKATDDFIGMGYEIESGCFYDEFRKIEIAFLTNNGYRVELVSPKDKDSAIGNLYKKIGNGPYHICYEVQNLKSAVEDMENRGFIVTIEPQCAPAIGDNNVVFMFSANIGMVELVEVNKQ